ncbi:MAG: hypothetical protein DDT19_00544 [Syntrophomonadaceae bacterium]|nr:hypothetical protein [Bacillota bacterium]
MGMKLTDIVWFVLGSSALLYVFHLMLNELTR